MPPPIISDTFEALEQLGGQMKQQTKQAAKVIIQEAKKQLGLASPGQGEQVPQEGGQTTELPKAPQIQEMEKIAQQKAAQRYRQIQEEILAISKRRQQELPKQVTGKPGFSEEEIIRQLGEEKKPEVQQEAEQAREEPLPLQRKKRKAEMFRGVGG